ncbi:MAG: FMN-binding negative transcriptional regulator [Salaquimonas sp.]
MHPNPIFRKTETEKNISFARDRSFGILSVNSEDGPLLSHIPFQLSEDGNYLEAHLVRSNPILRLLEEPVSAVVAVSGPDAYISPDWYGVDDQVPTWNYVAVHLRGMLHKLDQDELHGVLERLSAAFEARLLPKKPWVTDKMDQDIYQKMQRQIVPIGFEVSDIQGTWKLSQNKIATAISGAANGVETAGVGSETDTLVQLMRGQLDE